MKICPYCGITLKETSWNRKYCPNCGIIEEETETNKDEESKKPSYIR